MIPWKEATRGKKQQEAGVRERHSQSLGSRVMGGGERLREEDTVVGVLGLGAWRILQERDAWSCASQLVWPGVKKGKDWVMSMGLEATPVSRSEGAGGGGGRGQLAQAVGRKGTSPRLWRRNCRI